MSYLSFEINESAMKKLLTFSPVEDFIIQRPTLEEGLSLEEKLLESVCKGDLNFDVIAWSPTDRALVMPRKYERILKFNEAQRILCEKQWPVHFRSTGGTPVPQSPDMINITLVKRYFVSDSSISLESGYRELGDPWCAWLKSIGFNKVDLGSVPGSYCDGRFNIRIDGRKLVGTAQRWRKIYGSNDMAMLIHGAMQISDSPGSLVEIVNTFQDAIGNIERYHPSAHISLLEDFPSINFEIKLKELIHMIKNENFIYKEQLV